MDFEFTDEQEMFRKVVRDFAETEIAPHAEAWDRDHVFPTDTVRAMGRFAIAAYLNVPVYAAFHEWLGRGEQLTPEHAAELMEQTYRDFVKLSQKILQVFMPGLYAPPPPPPRPL